MNAVCTLCERRPGAFKWQAAPDATLQLICHPLCAYMQAIGMPAGKRGADEAELDDKDPKQRELSEEESRLVGVVDQMLASVNTFLGKPVPTPNAHKFRLVSMQNIGASMPPMTFYQQLKTRLETLRERIIRHQGGDLEAIRNMVANELERILRDENRIVPTGLLGELPADLQNSVSALATPIQQVFSKIIAPMGRIRYDLLRTTFQGLTAAPNDPMRIDGSRWCATHNNRIVQVDQVSTTFSAPAYKAQTSSSETRITAGSMDPFVSSIAVDESLNTFVLAATDQTQIAIFGPDGKNQPVIFAGANGVQIRQFEEHAPGQLVLLITQRFPMGMYNIFTYMFTTQHMADPSPLVILQPRATQLAADSGVVWMAGHFWVLDSARNTLSVWTDGATMLEIAQIAIPPSINFDELHADHKNRLVYVVSLNATGAHVATAYRLAQ